MSLFLVFPIEDTIIEI